MANTEADLPENVLLSHCWAQAFTKLLRKPCAPQKSQWSHSSNISVSLCCLWGMPTFHARYYPLSGRENRMEVISLVYAWKHWVLQNFLKAKWVDKITQLTKGGARMRTHASDSKSRAFFSTLYCTYCDLFQGPVLGGCLGSSKWTNVAPPH